MVTGPRLTGRSRPAAARPHLEARFRAAARFHLEAGFCPEARSCPALARPRLVVPG